jgi:arginyl-tRNA synthetase
MTLHQILTQQIQDAIQELFNLTIETIEFQATRKDFEGDVTMVVFPLVKVLKGNPVEIGTKIGTYLADKNDIVARFNVVGGFLNLVISDDFYVKFFHSIKDNEDFGFVKVDDNAKAIMVEYSSPNTNKPLHLGHIRNILLGYSVSEIIKASGKKAYKTQIINDRGIHICKSMLAWQKFAPKNKFGERTTPFTTKNKKLKKGDHFVGKYYVIYNNELKKELKKIYVLAKKEFEKYNSNNNIKTRQLESESKVKLIVKAYDSAFKKYLIYKKLLDYSYINEEYSNKILLNFNPDSNKYLPTANLRIKEITSKFKNQIPNINKYINNLDLEFDTNNSLKIFKIIKKELESKCPIHIEAQEMLRKWEAGDEEVVSLWKKMNQWVYDGFEETYKKLEVDFDSYYYESNTYHLGNEVINNELAKGKDKSLFYEKEDGSVWVNLIEDGLDEKIVRRSDGTAVYMTQDIGTAIQRVKDNPDVGGMVYTVGNEQDYHFKVLFLILKKLGFEWAESLYHLSYGMVELPSGKMKSREGTVVDADDLIAEMTATAQKISEELGKLDGYSKEEKASLYETIGLGALKYYMLKVDPKKQMLFNPEESVDFAGNTGPFIQYTYARIQSILRKADFDYSKAVNITLHEKEKELIKQIQLYPDVIQNAAANYSPALIANYTYDLVKEFNSFYQNVSILGESDTAKKIFRVQLSQTVGNTIKSAFKLLGIQVPERM